MHSGTTSGPRPSPTGGSPLRRLSGRQGRGERRRAAYGTGKTHRGSVLGSALAPTTSRRAPTMTACEQCWADASRDAQLLGGSVVDHYYRRIERDAVIKRAEAAEVERDRLAAEKAIWQAEAWERGYMFAFAQERGDHTHSRPVPDYLADDIRSWNPYLTSLNQTQG